MKFLILRKITETYDRWKDNDEKLVALGILLTDCLGGYVLRHINSLECGHHEIKGDLAYINFSASSKVTIGIQFSEDNPQEIILDKKNFNDILQKWKKLKEANVDEIVITRNKNNKVFILGRSLTPEEKLKQEQALKVWYDTPLDLKVDNEYFEEFQKTWYSFSFEELKQLEREFHNAAMNDESTDWDQEEQ